MSRKHFKRVDNMKKTGFNRYVYDFSIDYSDTAADVLDMHNYLMI